jgi:histidine triad (HIT) family protein
MPDETPPTRGSVVSLRPLTQDSLRSFLKLEVAEHQKAYVATNPISVAQAAFAAHPWQRGIVADETPVGYVLVDLDEDEGAPCIWRFMIDQRYQGLGFGSQAIRLIVDEIRRMRAPERVVLGTVPGEHTPKPFYERLGFRDTGERDEGELILGLDVEPPDAPAAPAPGSGAGSDFYCEQVLAGNVDVRRVAETDDVLAFHHTRPHWPVHIVVIPKRHVPSLTDLGDDGEALLPALLAVVRRVAAEVEAEHGAARVLTNLGGYQDSKHLHWHVCSGEPKTG